MRRFFLIVSCGMLSIGADAPVLPGGMQFEVDAPKQQVRIAKTEHPFAESELELRNLHTDEKVPPDKMKLIADEQTGDTLLRFPAFADGVLPDGIYQLTHGKSTLEFFVLAGDINRDRKVDTMDFNILSGNFGVVAASYSNGDLNYDGVVDSKDLNIFTSQKGKRLPSPTTLPSTHPS